MSEPVAPDAPSPAARRARRGSAALVEVGSARAPRQIVQPLQEFLQTSTASTSLLFLAVIVALVWANSPWKAGYEALLDRAGDQLGSLVDLDEDLHFWVNDGSWRCSSSCRPRDQA